MTDLGIVLAATAQIAINFWPALAFLAVHTIREVAR